MNGDLHELGASLGLMLWTWKIYNKPALLYISPHPHTNEKLGIMQLARENTAQASKYELNSAQRGSIKEINQAELNSDSIYGHTRQSSTTN
jgi:hypothetical protein